MQVNRGGPGQGRVYEQQFNPYTWADVTRRHQLYAITAAMSFGLGLLGTLIALVVVPHWRWFHHAIFTVIWAILAGAITALMWWTETERLFRWGLERIAAQAAVYILGRTGGLAHRSSADPVDRTHLSAAARAIRGRTGVVLDFAITSRRALPATQSR